MKSPEHLVQYQYKKTIKGSPAGHKEGKPTAGAPVKAKETPISGDHPAHLPPNTNRRNAAIEILLAGNIATKKPAMQNFKKPTAPSNAANNFR